MGRNRKMGLDYFPFDIDTFQDIKIRKLIKYQSGKAVTVYALLLCLIYKSGYYMRWDEELPFIISEQTGFEEAYIQEVIKSCMVLGLFSKELFDSEQVLTSKGIQIRYQDICKQIKRKCDFSEYSLISSEENGISSEEMGISSEEKPINSEKSTQKKRKEKENNKEINKETSSDEEAKKARLSLEAKEKELRDLESSLKAKEEELAKREAALNAKPAKAPPKLDFVEEAFKEVFQTWLDYKKERKESYKSEKSLKICYNQLLALSDNSPDKARLIVEQSIAYGWKGLFELKNNHSKPNFATHDNNKQYTDF